MKILYIANVRLPTEKAHGIQIMKTCEAFASLGHCVELVIPTRHNALTDSPFDYYNVKHVFKITTLRVPDFVRFGRLGFLFSALWFSERARWLKQFWNVDIVYSRDAFVLLQYLFLGRKIVFEAHQAPTRVSAFVARHSHSVVTISNGIKKAYEARGISDKKIIVAPDAVDEHFFDTTPSHSATRERLNIAEKESVVVYTGHLYKRKGAHVLAEAATYCPDTKFMFIGGTTADIEAFREQWGDNGNIYVIGHVLHTQIPMYLRAADVLVIPNSSKDDDTKHYASPMKLFEYMASGTPIIASDVPAIREILTESEATFFTPDNTKTLADAIVNVLKHRELAQKKALRAKEKVIEKYTWEKRAQHISKAINTNFI